MPEGLTPEQAAFWAAFLASPAAPPDAAARFHSAFGVGSGSEAGAAEILSGRKTATSALPADFLPGTPPVPGSLSLLYASGGRPVAIIETFSIMPLSLNQMCGLHCGIRRMGRARGLSPRHAGLVQHPRPRLHRVHSASGRTIPRDLDGLRRLGP